MEGTKKSKRVVIVGAGVGGMATAARLAKAGVQVSLYEKNDYYGGKCSNIVHDGYRFDRGASIMLMPELFEETFRHLGTSMSSEDIQLLKCEPNCKVWFDDGECFTTSTNVAHMKREIVKIEGPAGFQRYLDFLKECQQHYEQSVIHVLKKDFPSFFSLLRPAFLPYLFQLHPFQTVWQRVSNFFRSHKLCRVFSLGSMYLGMSPFEVPGTYTLLQCAELIDGVWYPIGGFYQVVEGLLQIGTRLGVKYHLSLPVEKVNVSLGKTVGVSLDSGTFVEADAVIINADLIYAFKKLLPPGPSTPNVLSRHKNISCSSISFYWSLFKTFPQLETHNMFVESSFGHRSTHIYMERESTTKSSFYVHVPSRIDPTAAPPGKDAVIVLVLVENLGDINSRRKGFDDSNLVSYVRENVISAIEERTGTTGFGKLIDHESVNTPSTWQESFNSEKGGLFGLDHNLFNILSFRPKIKHDSVAGVYFVGASTHPGAGVPTCLAGARLTAERVLEDLEVSIPWQTSNTQTRHICLRSLKSAMFAPSFWKWVLLFVSISVPFNLDAPTRGPANSSLLAVLYTIGYSQNIHADQHRGLLHHTVGLIFDSQPYLVLSSRGDSGIHIIRNSIRGNIFFHNPDISHQLALHYLDQASGAFGIFTAEE
ncbi:Phytoene desaturase [Penicillium verhagenii]|uniref:Phytoene desaturase n=1 Tax=Penicillium verhagenii TaxID=1562060 RepID=UPI0025454691|nr:Phytoene desaturase [Penicillium verhagenii]KAJ5936851.1 Phytoene desaturase [Penicillium verhagenii]